MSNILHKIFKNVKFELFMLPYTVFKVPSLGNAYVCSLEKADLFRQDFINTVQSFGVYDHEYINNLLGCMENTGVKNYVLKIDGEIVGYAAMQINNNLDGLRNAIIEDLCVSRNYRGRGLSFQFIAKLIDIAKKEGCDYCSGVSLEKLYKNIYEKLGFRMNNGFLYEVRRKLKNKL